MNDLISIIMPAYNTEEFIGRAIASVLAQTYEQWELIIIDDGSNDNTADVVKKVIDDRIKYVYQSNKGPGAARNKGLELVKGTYITFIDSDDLLHRKYLEILMREMKKNDADVTMCSYKKMKQKEIENLAEAGLPMIDSGYSTESFSGMRGIERMFYKDAVMPYPFLKLYNKKIVDGVSFPENIRLGEDLQFNLETLKKCDKVVYINSELYVHIENDRSITQSLNQKICNEHIEQLLYLYENENELLKKSISNRIFIVCYDFLCQICKTDRKKSELATKCKINIRRFRGDVISNPKSSIVSKTLAALSFVSISIAVWICERGKTIQLRKAV